MTPTDATAVSVAVVLIARTQPTDRADALTGALRLPARLQEIALVERTKPLTFVG